MGAESERPIDSEDCEMKFTLDVFSSLSQDVEDVARQGVLGNFSKARGMYTEALKEHGNKFPVYAEYLRLCLDGGDWSSLAKVSDYEAVCWSELATILVRLLRQVGTTMLEGYSRFPTNLTSVYTASFMLLKEFVLRGFGDYSNEEVCLKLRRLKPQANAMIDARCYNSPSNKALSIAVGITTTAWRSCHRLVPRLSPSRFR